MAALLDTLLEQEKQLQFTQFTSVDALNLGLAMLKLAHARPDKKPVTIDITRAGHQLFHFSMDGTGIDNDEWVKRKSRTVARFGHSSYYMGQKLAKDGQTVEEKYYISERDYATHGGSFPLIIKNVGPVGSITVSGLKQEEDHQMVVDAITAFLESQPQAQQA
ncbi:hypothetical protein BZG36_05247 [Bifiguratus adelaidae]|uniref:Uncharacterized protein n=1 Tax=Bifiguratus adelaidae TaxID=1938954 RepID=A0A261XUF3_9FUNG|nr:hypothetical protein BZG36_05247 [Bifiguratus adelaidae]